ncbi:MAG: HAD hydrolase-like protein [Eggerthellaceae bacterium]|nr:HAD hydrolase-like protein [Eggerthellaceae bacterium]
MGFRPDKAYDRITDIDCGMLVSAGITTALVDVDNTVLPRDTHIVPDDIMQWLGFAKQANLKVYLLSNNWHKEIYTFAQSLDLPIVAKAMKPFPFAFWIAKNRANAKRNETVCIGDQLFTDVFGAHLSGMKAYMVKPLSDVDLWYTKLFRKAEKRLLKDPQKQEAKRAD